MLVPACSRPHTHVILGSRRPFSLSLLPAQRAGPALLEAAGHGDAAEARRLIAIGADVNVRDAVSGGAAGNAGNGYVKVLNREWIAA